MIKRVEDNPGDARLIQQMLQEPPVPAFEMRCDRRLDDVVRSERGRNRPGVAQRYRRVPEFQTCHGVCLRRSAAKRWVKTFAGLQDRNILTMEDADDFARSGRPIQFATRKGKTRLNINGESAKASDLMISSHLLGPAEIITAGKV